MSDRPADLSVPALGAETPAWVYGPTQTSESGPKVVLVHGFRGDHHGLEKIARELSVRMPDRSILVPDLPGFGSAPAIAHREHSIDTYAEWLREFCANAAPEGCAIVGHSFGSLVVSRAIATGLEPHATVLINPITTPALAGPRALMTQLTIAYYALAARLPAAASRAFLGNRAIVRAMSELMAKTPDRELRRWIHAQHRAYFSRFADSQTLLQAFRASVSHTVLDDAASLSHPLLLIAGESDDITRLADQVALRNRVPGSRLVVIPSVGHLVHYEAAELAAAHIATLHERISGVHAKAGEPR